MFKNWEKGYKKCIFKKMGFQCRKSETILYTLFSYTIKYERKQIKKN